MRSTDGIRLACFQPISGFMMTLVIIAAFVICSIGEALAAAAQDNAPATYDEPIKIATFDWTSSALTTTILAKLLTEKGMSVEMIAASSLTSATEDLSTGDLTIGLEYRVTDKISDLQPYLVNPHLDVLGDLGPRAQQIWWYPDYVAKQCPGLPDWNALFACAQQFSSPQSSGRGLLISGPVGNGYADDTRIAALGLPFDVVHVATDTTIVERLDGAIAAKKPILISLSMPNWIQRQYKGFAVALPEWDPNCVEQPSWGVNKLLTNDCGAPAGPIVKIAWSGMKQKWPEAWRIAKKLRFDDAELSQMLLDVDYNGKTLDAVADQWIANHRSLFSNSSP